MQVPRSMFYAFQLILVLAIVAIIGLVIFLLLTTEIDTVASDASHKAEIARMQATADTYSARLQYYDGVCKAAGASAPYRCVEGEAGYALSITLTDGTYCADSTGFRGTIDRAIGSSIRCQE